jgi:hypothetical protein
MAKKIHFASSATAPSTDEESDNANWIEITIMVISIGITVLIVGTISIMMATA